MTKVIIIQGGSLESFYEQTLEYLHAKYHSYPSYDPMSVDPQSEIDLHSVERLAKNIAKAAKDAGYTNLTEDQLHCLEVKGMGGLVL